MIDSSPSAGAAPMRGIRRGSSGFESEFATYLQGRLRVLALWLFVLIGALYLIDTAAFILMGHGARLFIAFRNVMLVDVVCLGFCVLAARRPSLSSRGLAALDVALYALSAGLALALFHLNYGTSEHLLHWLGAAVVARAILVPSRPGRTLWLGLAVMAAVAGSRAYWSVEGRAIGGFSGMTRVEPYASGWWLAVVWRTVELATFVTIAVTASHVTFSLRLKAYESRQLDQYVLEGRIGQGAMGEVHRARHALMKRPVAIKFIRAEIVGAAAVKRFEKEVQSTSRLTHPNTIAIYDYGQTPDGLFYYAMEHLDGADLERVVESTGPLPASRVIHVLVQACGALDEAHDRGLVHRDVKPANLFLCGTGLGRRRDVVKVMDFGLVRDTAGASMTQVGDVVGTPHTIAPECLRGQPATPASDLYSLGAVACFLLTGRPIFDAATAGEFIAAHLTTPPIAPSARVPSVPADLEEILLRCLRKPPADRWTSAADLREALLRCADAERWTDADAAAWWERHAGGLAAATPSAA